MRLPRLTLAQQLSIILVVTMLATQLLTIWIDRIAQADRYRFLIRDNGPGTLAGKLLVIEAVPQDLRPRVARALSDPINQVFMRNVPGLHPTDLRNPDLEARAMAWMLNNGLPVAELIVASRRFDELPLRPPDGLRGKRSGILRIGAAPPMVTPDQLRGFVPPWVTGDWSSLDPEGQTAPTSDPVSGPPRTAPEDRPSTVPPVADRARVVTVHTFAARLKGQDTWVTLYRLENPPPFNASLTKLLLSGLLTLALAVFAILMGRRIMAPLRDLAQSSETLGRGEKGAEVIERGPVDLRGIISAFNQMNARVSQSVDYQIGLLRSLGHDLKGPLASVGRLVGSVGPETTRQEIETRLEKVQGIVDSILSFSRAVMRDGALEKTDLATLTETVIDDFVDAGGDVKGEVPDEMLVVCRVGATKRGLRNLIENALKYTGSASVRLLKEDGDAVIQVDDNGPGIPEDALASVFEPFKRLSATAPGTGLGLAIVRTIIVDQGGTVTLSNLQNGGLRAEIRLPLPSAEDATV